MKNNNIPEYLLCSTPELARQVLEKIERESDLRWWFGKKPSEVSLSDDDALPLIIDTTESNLSAGSIIFYSNKGITNFTKAEDFLNNNYMTEKTWDNLDSCECERCFKCGKLVNR